MTDPTISPQGPARNAGTFTDDRRASPSRGLGRARGLGRSFAFALTLLFAVVGSAVAAGGAAAGPEGRLVATTSKIGRDGHPYLWAPPSC